MARGRVPSMSKPIPYAIQTFPGEQIYLRTGNDEPLPISDMQALFLSFQLMGFVLGNMQVKARANGH